jgi:hypothetical protein
MSELYTCNPKFPDFSYSALTIYSLVGTSIHVDSSFTSKVFKIKLSHILRILDTYIILS